MRRNSLYYTKKHLSYNAYFVQFAKLHIFLQIYYIYPFFFHIVGGYVKINMTTYLAMVFTLFEKQQKAQPQLLGVAP